MAEVIKIKCDNPRCKSIGDSESDPPHSTKDRAQPLLPPYGWLTLDGGFMGCGPYFKNLTACKVECVAPAIEAFVHRDIEENHR